MARAVAPGYDASHMDGVEALVLCGGRSRRMGSPKGDLVVGAGSLAARIVGACAGAGLPVTVQGGKPVAGAGFRPDLEPGGGPVVNLRGFVPARRWVLLCACDLVRFHAGVIRVLWNARADDRLAVVPCVQGRRQPMCALYQARSFSLLAERVEFDRVMAWVDALDPVVLDEASLAASGIDARDVMGANTPEEFRALSQGLGA